MSDGLIADVTEILGTNYMGLASFTLLIWDHIITFEDEIEYIWKGGSHGPIVFLFLINRYLTPLSFVINLFAYFSPYWTPDVTSQRLGDYHSPTDAPMYARCAHFVRYEGVTVALAVEIVGLMMLLRIDAIYSRHRLRKWVTPFLALFLVFETAINVWLISGAGPVPHTPNSGIHSCTMIFSQAVGSVAAASAWIPLLYDTIVMALTLYRTVPAIRAHHPGRILTILVEDGMLYFSVIFSINVVLTIMIIAAPAGIKNITAQLSQLLTVAMMSRITIRLKKTGRAPYEDNDEKPTSMVVFNVHTFQVTDSGEEVRIPHLARSTTTLRGGVY